MKPNGSSIYRWNADSVPLSVISFSGSLTMSAVGEEVVDTQPDGKCKYKAVSTYDVDVSFSGSFTRIAFNADTNPTGTNFYVYRNDDNSVYSHILGADGSFGLLDYFETKTASTSWSVTYTYLDGGMGCTNKPADDSGTDDGSAVFFFGIQQSGDLIIPTGSITVSTIGPWIVDEVTSFTDRIVTVHDLKYGGGVNFGSTLTYGSTNPDPSYWTTWSVVGSITFSAG